MRSAEAERGVVKRRSPGHVAGPKPCYFARGDKSRGRAGNRRVRVLVVESLRSKHRSDVSEVLVWRSVARPYASRVPSLKEAATLYSRNPGDEERSREGKNGALFSRKSSEQELGEEKRHAG